MASKPLEDDSDPTYTHFAHRDEFMAILDKFTAINTEAPATSGEDFTEGGMVKSMGNIVSSND